MAKEKKKKFGYKNLLKTMSFYKNHKGTFVLGVIAMVIFAILGFIEPIYRGNTMASIAELKLDYALKLTIALIFIYIVRVIMQYFINSTYSKLNTRVLFDVKHRLIDTITTVSMKEMDKTNTGVFIERLHEDTRKCSDILMEIIAMWGF